MNPSRQPDPPHGGGIARFFVEHREVSWALLLAVLCWGWFSFTRLGQQEDPKIPERRALLVTAFPGATAAKVEQLVTRKLEKKVSELSSLDEITSESRAGVSIIHVTLRFDTTQKVEQEWDKLRAKLSEVDLPTGCLAPALDTDFGNTITLLYAITSPMSSDAECRVRAHLLGSRLQQHRRQKSIPGDGRAAIAVFFPADVAPAYLDLASKQFADYLNHQGVAEDTHLLSGAAFRMVEFATSANRERLKSAYDRFVTSVSTSEGQMHPDVSAPIILIGDDDPLPQIQQARQARYSYRELEKTAEKVEDTLKQAPSVGRVRQIGVVKETVYLLFSLATINGYDLSANAVMNAIASRNALIPSGTFRTQGQNFPVQLSGEFKNETELMSAIVGLTSNGPVYLRDLFEVRRGYENPIPYAVDLLKRSKPDGHLNTYRSVLVSVEMKEGQNISRFDRQVRAALEAMHGSMADGIEVIPVSDQPRAVTQRLITFYSCFLEAVGIVVLVCLFLMDWRAALVVAAAIPLTVALTLVGMQLFSIPLQQISIASMILALGMLVDDPVVASDGINREMAHGQARGVAAWLGPYRLRRPILYATVINIAAFLPLVLLPDDKGAFIFSLPMVVTLALASSRVVSMTFVPLLGYHLLKGQKGFETGGEVRSCLLFSWVDRFLVGLLPRYRRLLEWSLEHPWRGIGGAYGALALSLFLIPFLGQQFFPPAERNQMLIDVELPESASLGQTRAVCDEIARLLRTCPQIETAAVFTGGTAPRFYYNVEPKEPANHLAQILINTRRADDVVPLLVHLRHELDRTIVGARCICKQLEQGPPVNAPIQIRLSGDNLTTLRNLADQVATALREANAYHVHDDLGRQLPSLEIRIDQERANVLGIDNSLVGQITQAAFSGLQVTELREEDHLIPVVIRLRVEERNEAEKLRTFYVESLLPSNRHQPIPLASFADVRIRPEFATIAHYDQLRTVTVKAYAHVGELAATTLDRARDALMAIRLPPGYRLEIAGEAKELQQSQREMGWVMAVSLGLIALAMVAQFYSVIKSLVVMLTVPLGLIGAFIGLALTQSALGFMALLGIVSLAGVIVSHIIVLSDFIEEARRDGMELKQALIQAGLVRLRAVLVTVLATVGGLIPLALKGGELWRPLTAVHIFGLLLATGLTLVVLPLLYSVFCAKQRGRPEARSSSSYAA
ncbi:MAG TPA: efflux RND transporter permease subunit [Candidatus Paceibacterota bacterium]|nr:efflux RND transporter permease subunit [Verrucomicrobiota bacterium]HRY49264.1 efflux RND transporter permease subunit [Candidatus Paceibacterota bacterium]HSA00478.1 efflux RND transporter permease subunit [Candidatus Paceibacterota bacterium]